MTRRYPFAAGFRTRSPRAMDWMITAREALDRACEVALSDPGIAAEYAAAAHTAACVERDGATAGAARRLLGVLP